MSRAEESIHSPITSLLGACMQALVRKIERTNAPGNLDGLFAYHVIGNEPDFTLTWRVSSATELWLAKNYQTLSHFHVLAVAGYALWHFENTAPIALRKAFTDGLAMLRLRDPFPEDRNSFAYQPRAFLGIALGVTTLGDRGATYRSWLIELLDDHRCRSSIFSSAFQYGYIRYILTGETMSVGDVKHYTNLQDLAMLEWSMRHQVVHLPDPQLELSKLQAQILRRSLVVDISEFDSSQAAVIWSAIHASLARSVEQLVLSRNHVGMILRRFEAALRRWRWDDSTKIKRPINWAITSEREVQDIVWMILRSVFDDIVDEETLPKLGHSTYKADFGIPSLRLLIEAKYCREASDFKKIEKEIMEDAVAYLINIKERYDRIIVFIYDHSSSVQEHALTAAALKELPGIEDVIIVSRPSQLPVEFANPLYEASL
jgi:REase_DpnII-MboI